MKNLILLCSLILYSNSAKPSNISINKGYKPNGADAAGLSAGLESKFPPSLLTLTRWSSYNSIDTNRIKMIPTHILFYNGVFLYLPYYRDMAKMYFILQCLMII